MKKLLLSSLASALAFAATLPAQAEVIQTTTETQLPAQVVDSYMKPTVSRTKSVTAADGTTEKTVEPLIQERQERVIIPTEKVTTTTDITPARVVSEEVRTDRAASTTVVRKRVASRKRVAPRRRLAVRRTVRRRVAVKPAVTSSVAVRHTVVQPQIVQQSQTVEQKAVIIDRPDPALKLP